MWSAKSDIRPNDTRLHNSLFYVIKSELQKVNAVNWISASNGDVQIDFECFLCNLGKSIKPYGWNQKRESLSRVVQVWVNRKDICVVLFALVLPAVVCIVWQPKWGWSVVSVCLVDALSPGREKFSSSRENKTSMVQCTQRGKAFLH